MCEVSLRLAFSSFLAACFSFSVLPCFFALDFRGDFPAMTTPSALLTLRRVAPPQDSPCQSWAAPAGAAHLATRPGRNLPGGGEHPRLPRLDQPRDRIHRLAPACRTIPADVDRRPLPVNMTAQCNSAGHGSSYR